MKISAIFMLFTASISSVFAQEDSGSDGATLLFAVIFWVVVGGGVGMAIGSRKGEKAGGFLLGFLLGPLGWIIALVSKGNRIPCPHCRELIDPEATVCPRCSNETTIKAVPVARISMGVVHRKDQIPYEDFKRKLFRSDPAYSSFREQDLQKMYLEGDPLAQKDQQNDLGAIDISLFKGGEYSGPFRITQIKQMWLNGSITADTLYWYEGLEGWQAVTDLIN